MYDWFMPQIEITPDLQIPTYEEIEKSGALYRPDKYSPIGNILSGLVAGTAGSLNDITLRGISSLYDALVKDNGEDPAWGLKAARWLDEQIADAFTTYERGRDPSYNFGQGIGSSIGYSIPSILIGDYKELLPGKSAVREMLAEPFGEASRTYSDYLFSPNNPSHNRDVARAAALQSLGENVAEGLLQKYALTPLGEKIGGGIMGKLIGDRASGAANAIRAVGREAIAGILSQGTEEMLQSAIEKYNSPEYASQQQLDIMQGKRPSNGILDNIINNNFAERWDKTATTDNLKDMIIEGIYGALTGGIMGGGVSAYNRHAITSNANRAIGKNSNVASILNDVKAQMAENPNLSNNAAYNNILDALEGKVKSFDDIKKDYTTSATNEGYERALNDALGYINVDKNGNMVLPTVDNNGNMRAIDSSGNLVDINGDIKTIADANQSEFLKRITDALGQATNNNAINYDTVNRTAYKTEDLNTPPATVDETNANNDVASQEQDVTQTDEYKEAYSGMKKTLNKLSSTKSIDSMKKKVYDDYNASPTPENLARRQAVIDKYGEQKQETQQGEIATGVPNSNSSNALGQQTKIEVEENVNNGSDTGDAATNGQQIEKKQEKPNIPISNKNNATIEQKDETSSKNRRVIKSAEIINKALVNNTNNTTDTKNNNKAETESVSESETETQQPKSTVDTVTVNQVDDEQTKTPLTKEGVKSLLGNNKRIRVIDTSNGNFYVITPSGHFVVNKSGKVSLSQNELDRIVNDNKSSFNTQDDVERFKKNPFSSINHLVQYGGKNGIAVDTINIIKGLSDNSVANSEFRHEAFHIAENLAFTPKQKKRIYEAFKNRAKDKANGVNISVSEAAANAFANWNTGKEQQHGEIKSLFKKMKDILVSSGMIQANGDTEIEQLVKDFRDGKVFENNNLADYNDNGNSKALIQRSQQTEDFEGDIKELDNINDTATLDGESKSIENELAELKQVYENKIKSVNDDSKLNEEEKQEKIINTDKAYKEILEEYSRLEDGIKARKEKLEAPEGIEDEINRELSNIDKSKIKLVGRKGKQAVEKMSNFTIDQTEGTADIQDLKERGQARLTKNPSLLIADILRDMYELSERNGMRITDDIKSVSDLQEKLPAIANELRGKAYSKLFAASNDYGIDIKNTLKQFFNLNGKSTLKDVTDNILNLGLQKNVDGKSLYTNFSNMLKYEKNSIDKYTASDRDFMRAIGAKYSSYAEKIDSDDIYTTPLQMIKNKDRTKRINTFMAVVNLYHDLVGNEIGITQFFKDNGISENRDWAQRKVNAIESLINNMITIKDSKIASLFKEPNVSAEEVLDYLYNYRNSPKLRDTISDALDQFKEHYSEKDGNLQQSISNIFGNLIEPVIQKGGHTITFDVAYDSGVSMPSGDPAYIAFQYNQNTDDKQILKSFFEDMKRRKGTPTIDIYGNDGNRKVKGGLIVLPNSNTTSWKLNTKYDLLSKSMTTTLDDLTTLRGMQKVFADIKARERQALENMSKFDNSKDIDKAGLADEYSGLENVFDDFGLTFDNDGKIVRMDGEEWNALPDDVKKDILQKQEYADIITDTITRRASNPMRNPSVRKTYKIITELAIAKRIIENKMKGEGKFNAKDYLNALKDAKRIINPWLGLETSFTDDPSEVLNGMNIGGEEIGYGNEGFEETPENFDIFNTGSNSDSNAKAYIKPIKDNSVNAPFQFVTIEKPKLKEQIKDGVKNLLTINTDKDMSVIDKVLAYIGNIRDYGVSLTNADEAARLKLKQKGQSGDVIDSIKQTKYIERNKSAGFAETGKADFTIDGKKKSVSLKPISQMIKDYELTDQKYSDFNTGLLALRLAELSDRYKTPLSKSEYLKIADRVKAKYSDFGSFQKDFKAHTDTMLDMAYAFGEIDKSAYQRVKATNKYYAPIQQVFEGNIDATKDIVENLLDEKRTIKFFKDNGSLDNVSPVIDTLYSMEHRAFQNAERTKLINELCDMKDTDGKPIFVKSDVNSDGALRFFEDGKAKYFKSANRDIGDMLLNVITRPSYNWENKGWYKFLKFPADLTRKGVNYIPKRAITNFIGDNVQAGFTVDGYNIYTDGLRGLFHVLKQDDVFERAVKAGAFQTLSRDSVNSANKSIEEMIQSNEKFNAKNALSKIASWVSTMNEISERATRLAVFERELKNGRSEQEAAMRAVDLLNFSAGNEATRFLNGVTPFFNSTLQATNNILRSMTKDRALNASMRMAFQLSLPAVLAFMWNHRDKDTEDLYKDLPQYVKDNYFTLIFDKDNMIKIPTRRHTVGKLFSALPERLLSWMYDNDRKAFDGFVGGMTEDLLPSDVPQILKLPIELMTNYDFFKQKPIVSESEKRYLPHERYSAYTSGTMVGLASIFSKMGFEVSPKVLEHIADSVLASTGAGALDTVDALTGNSKKSVKDRLPIVSGFYGNTIGGKIENDFRSELEEAMQAYNTAKRNQDNGEETEEDKSVLRFKSPLRKMQSNDLKKLQALSKEISNIRKDKRMSSSVQDRLIRDRERKARQIATEGLQKLRRITDAF